MTTTITMCNLSDELEVRITALAEEAGKTSHAFVGDALEAEARREFVASALRAEQEVAENGEVYSMDAAHKYFRDRLAGRSAKRPKPAETNR